MNRKQMSGTKNKNTSEDQIKSANMFAQLRAVHKACQNQPGLTDNTMKSAFSLPFTAFS